jgi:hypothetical protein
VCGEASAFRLNQHSANSARLLPRQPLLKPFDRVVDDSSSVLALPIAYFGQGVGNERAQGEALLRAEDGRGRFLECFLMPALSEQARSPR